MSVLIPALCFGERYVSLSRSPIPDLASGEKLGEMGLVLENRVAIDCGRAGLLRRARDRLREIPVRRRIEMCVAAAGIFESGTLEGGGLDQSPGDYRQLLCCTSGLSHRLAGENTARIAAALRATEEILRGLSRGMPLEAFDGKTVVQGDTPVRLLPRFKALAALMPNNSPGVHVTWLPAVALGTPVLVRPGSGEPFTPYRLIQSLVAAGFPIECFGFYPCDHPTADRIPELTGGAIVFGADATVNRWAGNPCFQLHGAGFSKLVVGEDLIDDWERLIPALAENVAANSGRSCYTVSLMFVPRHADKIARAIAERLATMVPRPLDHPDATLSAMAMPARAKQVTGEIDDELKIPGASDVSAEFRTGDRLQVFEGRTYMLPTIIRCATAQHPLARQEYLFPFAAVVEASSDQAFAQLGKTLSLAVYSNDAALQQRARECDVALVSINVPTFRLDRRQPHEGNLVDLCLRRASIVES